MKAILLGSVAVLGNLISSASAVSSEMHQELSRNGVHHDHRMLSEQQDLFTQPKSQAFQPKFSMAPEMKMTSPMGRFITRKKIKDEDGNIVEDDSLVQVDQSDTNPRLEPCGGYPRGRVHFDAIPGSKAMIAWKTKFPDVRGNCTIRLGSKSDTGSFTTIYPTDGSGKKNKGKFPCGREASSQESKMIKFPANTTCDSCTLQLIWDTKAAGKLNMCADISITSGDKVADCSGQCGNGGICLNGECECRKGFQGKFCEIVEYVPDKTNYTMYLKYFLFFIIMVLVIIALLFGGYLLFKNADKIRNQLKVKEEEEKPLTQSEVEAMKDPDSLAGPGIQSNVDAPQSRFGQNADLFNDQ